MSAQPAVGTGLFIQGTRESGSDVRIANVTAATAVANIVKSSLGPVGLDKMLVDDIGDVLITNDGATILNQIEVEHPAARVLVDLAQLQDKEVGDGTTSVVIVAAELLKRGSELIGAAGSGGNQHHHHGGLHPTTVISGFRTALKAAVAFLKKEMVLHVSDLSQDHLVHAARTSMSSKLIGKEGDFFAQMAVDAVKSVKMLADKSMDAEEEPAAAAAATTNNNNNNTGASSSSSGSTFKAGKYRYPLSAIHILKATGKSSLESKFMAGGFCLNATRAAQGMPTNVGGGGSSGSGEDDNGNANGSSELVKIAFLDMNLQRHRMGMGIQVTVKDPQEIERIRKREMDITKERITKILDSGAKVVLTTKGVDDLCLKYFVEAGVICSRRCNKDDLKRLAKASGGKVVTTMADMEGNESFDGAESLGTCKRVTEERIGDGEMLHFYGCTGGGASTIVLRGANEYMLDEMDRALHDSLSVVKRMLESNTLVPGGGAVEAALSVYLEEYATTCLDTREQMAVLEFADALLVIPKTLSVNAAKDSSELVAKLRACHARKEKNMGLDLIEGTIRDNLAAGVVEPAISKIKSLRFATEAAITILRIDDRISVTENAGH